MARSKVAAPCTSVVVTNCVIIDYITFDSMMLGISNVEIMVRRDSSHPINFIVALPGIELFFDYGRCTIRIQTYTRTAEK